MVLSEINNYIEDNWNDNALSNRTNSETGYFLHPSDSLINDFEAGDVLKGMYRPDWTATAGSPTVSSGSVEFQADETIRVNSTFSAGRWVGDMEPLNPSNTLTYFTPLMVSTQTIDDGYPIVMSDANSSYNLERRSGGSANQVVSSTWSQQQKIYTVEATRDPYGNFEMLLDGASKGTGTDTTHTEFRNCVIEQGSRGTIQFYNMTVQ